MPRGADPEEADPFAVVPLEALGGGGGDDDNDVQARQGEPARGNNAAARPAGAALAARKQEPRAAAAAAAAAEGDNDDDDDDARAASAKAAAAVRAAPPKNRRHPNQASETAVPRAGPGPDLAGEARPHDVKPVVGSATGMVKQFLASASLPADVNMYIPDFVKTYAAGGEQARVDAQSRERVLSVALERLGGMRVAVLGYESGFQVWRLGTDSEPARELTSVRHGGVRLCHCLAEPLLPSKFDNVQPLLALVPITNRDRKLGAAADVVRIFSVRNQKIVHKLPMQDRVVAMQSSPRFFAVATRARVTVFNAATFEEQHSIDVAVPPLGVETSFALGHRWLAYVSPMPDAVFPDDTLVHKEGPAAAAASGKPAPAAAAAAAAAAAVATAAATTYSAAEQSSPRAAAVDALADIGAPNWSSSVKGAAKELASGLYYLGDLGLRKLDEKRNGPLDPEKAAEARELREARHSNEVIAARYARAGVVVRDLVSGTVVAAFRSHGRSAGKLCFDPTGSLLVVCSLDGQAINVHKIIPQRAGVGQTPSHLLLYRLSRGITSAVIRDVSFSEDLRWLAVTSARGTTHIFSICLTGGMPSTLTHRTVSHAAAALAMKGRATGADASSSASCATASSQRAGSCSPCGEPREGWRIRERFASFSSSLTSGSPPTLMPSPLSSSFGSSSSTAMSSSASSAPSSTSLGTAVSALFPPSTEVLRGPAIPSPCKLAAVARIRQNVNSLSALLASDAPVSGVAASPSQPARTSAADPSPASQEDAAAAAAEDSLQENRSSTCACASFHDGSLFLLSGTGLLQQYKLIPVPNERDHREIDLKTVASSTWDICRRDHWHTFAKPASFFAIHRPSSASPSLTAPSAEPTASKTPSAGPAAAKTATSDADEKQAERHRLLWLSNVEIFTHAAPITHIWTAPQFQFATYDQDAALSSIAKLFIERANSTTVQVRGAGPTPTFAPSPTHGTSTAKTRHRNAGKTAKSGLASKSSGVANNGARLAAPSSTSSGNNSSSNNQQYGLSKTASTAIPVMRGLRTAINTPAEFQDLYIAGEQELDEHILVFDDDMLPDSGHLHPEDPHLHHRVTSKDFGDNDDINDNDDGDCNHAQDMDEDDLLGLSDSEAPALHFIEDEDGFMLGSCDLPRPKQE